MRELRGKGWRVLGYFLWMVGAGVVLDSDALGAGRLLLALGAALFATGVWQSARADGAQR
jgi:membrane protein implicated in regulation of membrane protease activity